nr:prepilin-type N-terminal cleavage/methylation domain-containing protein [Candidatus Levybacteria bacterium]
MELLLVKIKMKQKGQTLIELLIAIGLSAILIPALLVGFSATRNGRAQQEQRLQATSYLKEAQEAIRIIAANNWDNLANSTYHPVVSGSTWALAAGPEAISGFGFTRQIVIGDVYRDSNGNIVTSSGTLDPSTKHITISVSWTNPIASSVSADSYLTRHKNLSHLETTVADFTPGALNPFTNGITITNTNGGEIILGAGGGGGDWCQPNLTLAQLDLPKSGVANAISAIEGQVFAGTGDNSSGVSFADVKITTTYPPVPTLQKTFDGYKTNGVFGEANYGYLAVDNNFKEIVIINLTQYSDPPTNSKYKEEGYFNAPGNGDGNSIYASTNYGYMTSGNKFYIFDLSGKTGSRPQVNPTAVTLSGTGVKTIVVGSYAYVATSGTTNQLQIINVSNPASPSIAGSITVAGQGGKDVYVNSSGTRAYLVTGSSGTQREFFIIDTQTKTSPSLISGGTYDTNGMDPKGVTVVTGNRAIVVGTGGTYQYQVINISNENSPISCGNLQVATGINGVASVLQSDGYAYSYIITGDASSELKIILGGAGAGGGNYAFSGVFESATFDAGKESAWNTLFTTVSAPINTTLQFKVALKHAINNSCSGVSFGNSDFVGPDGQTSSYFPSTGGILSFDNNGSGYENPAQCERYRAYFTTSDSTQTPVIYDVSLSYSP